MSTPWWSGEETCCLEPRHQSKGVSEGGGGEWAGGWQAGEVERRPGDHEAREGPSDQQIMSRWLGLPWAATSPLGLRVGAALAGTGREQRPDTMGRAAVLTFASAGDAEDAKRVVGCFREAPPASQGMKTIAAPLFRRTRGKAEPCKRRLEATLRISSKVEPRVTPYVSNCSPGGPCRVITRLYCESGQTRGNPVSFHDPGSAAVMLRRWGRPTSIYFRGRWERTSSTRTQRSPTTTMYFNSNACGHTWPFDRLSSPRRHMETFALLHADLAVLPPRRHRPCFG